ncbi:MAG: TetR/AcrR family transcriptional regulator, partial [Thermoanaerobaculia bacterium]|nr:TetR/AcrR family transcriptional regulator [Thermoanaerobaculia bacterium]
LFAAQGYEAVTMRKIAAAIEYSATAIYLHFADKEAIVRELCDTDFAHLATHFRKIAKTADPLARLRAAGRAYAAFGAKHPNHYRLMFMTPHPPHHPEDSKIEVGNPEQDAYAFLKWTVGEAIAQGRLRAELVDVELVSQIVWAGIHGIVSLRLSKHNEPWVAWRAERKTVELMLDTLIRGIARAPEA